MKMASFKKKLSIIKENVKEKSKWHLEKSIKQHTELFPELWIKRVIYKELKEQGKSECIYYLPQVTFFPHT